MRNDSQTWSEFIIELEAVEYICHPCAVDPKFLVLFILEMNKN